MRAAGRLRRPRSWGRQHRPGHAGTPPDAPRVAERGCEAGARCRKRSIGGHRGPLRSRWN